MDLNFAVVSDTINEEKSVLRIRNIARNNYLNKNLERKEEFDSWKILYNANKNVSLMTRTAIVYHDYPMVVDTKNSKDKIVKESMIFIYFLSNSRSIANVTTLLCDFITDDNIIHRAVAKIIVPKKSYRYFWTGLQEYFLTCKLNDKRSKVNKVSLTDKDTKNSIDLVVKYPYSTPKNITLCLPIVYGFFERNMLIEWFEYYKWLGVDNFHTDVWNVSSSVLDVLKFYERENLISFQYVKSPIDFNYEWKENSLITNEKPMILKSLMAPLLNECFLLNKKRSKYILSVDFDEFITLKKQKKLLKLFEEYNKKFDCTSQLSFGHLFFDVTCNLTRMDTSSFLFSHTFRDTDFRYYAKKSLINPNNCDYISNHECIRSNNEYLSNFKNFYSCYVKLDDGYFGHYRKQSKCDREKVDTYIEDTIMLRYQDDLHVLFKNANYKFQNFLTAKKFNNILKIIKKLKQLFL